GVTLFQRMSFQAFTHGSGLSSRAVDCARVCVLAFTLLATGCHRAAPDRAEGSALERVDLAAAGSLRAIDFAGQKVNRFDAADAKWLVFVFISVDCPISNRYAPEIRRLHARFAPQGVKFWLIHPNADESASDIRKHNEDYQYRIEALRDPKHLLV